ncbi:galactose oxidase, partial [Candidatus Poribacteria bacterium]|nr:galactose oxidase [Candidatus Poribacteria bacterium]
ADMPTARRSFSTSVVDGKIYAIGGRVWRQVLATIESYDPATDTWTKKADMPTPRGALSASAVNGKIYAIGGFDANSTALSTVEEYDPKMNSWTKKADMPTPRWAFSTSVVNGKIYAIGGFDGARVLSTVEEYDPKMNSWTKKASMPTARTTSTSVVNGKIYAIGDFNGTFIISTVEEYDPRANTWTRKANLPTWRNGLCTSAVNGTIYAIGGVGPIAGGGTGAISVVEAYDPRTDTWTKKSDMPTPRWGLSTVAVNGKIYAIGGAPGDGRVTLSTVEEYDTGFAGQGVEAKGKLSTLWGKLKASN